MTCAPAGEAATPPDLVRCLATDWGVLGPTPARFLGKTERVSWNKTTCRIMIIIDVLDVFLTWISPLLTSRKKRRGKTNKGVNGSLVLHRLHKRAQYCEQIKVWNWSRPQQTFELSKVAILVSFE